MLDDNEEVSICRITNSTDLNKIQGSKYVYSYVKNTYLEVKQDLESGKQILYIGLPCQIAGLYNSLKGGEYPNLITVDIICHGSVSQLLWKEHVEYLQKKLLFHMIILVLEVINGMKIIIYVFMKMEKQF